MTLNVKVNHGMSYRDGAWAMVDVFVDNPEKDVTGWVEVTTFSLSGDRQSPVYRVPADSPKGSKKRFRVYAFLQDCDRIEARLYHKNRPAHDFPAQLRLGAIEQEAFMCLILDDHPENYGFLNRVFIEEERGTRIYREGLDTMHLGAMADYLQCYENFNVIIIGDVDVTRIRPEHRDLLTDYVRNGGTLAVMTGSAAGRLRDTWIEDLCQTSVLESEVANGRDLAQAVFSAEASREGAKADRQGFVATLKAQDSRLKTWGSERVLATQRGLGAGRALMFSLGGETELLQDCTGYLILWRGLLRPSGGRMPLNFMQAAWETMNTAPMVAGVQLLPIRSVIMYLLTYFVVAILGNWLFWNWMKRREMAWVCLVLFSIAFTGYAMFYGTQGRAKETEMAQFEVLEVPSGADEAGAALPALARLTSFTGVLAAGTGQFDGVVTQTNALVTDLASYAKNAGYLSNPYGNQNSRNSFTPRPFYFLQGESGSIHNLRVGASEMRFLHATAPINLPGALEESISLSGQQLSGTLKDHGGLGLQNPQLMYKGRSYPLKREGDGWTIDASLHTGNLVSAQRWQPYQNYGGQTRDKLERFKGQFLCALLSGENLNFDTLQVDSITPPCIVAWSGGGPRGAIQMGNTTRKDLSATLIVSPVSLEQATPERESPLMTRYRALEANQGRGYRGGIDQTGSWQERPSLESMDLGAFAGRVGILDWNASASVGVHIQEWMQRTPCMIEITLWFAAGQDARNVLEPIYDPGRSRRSGRQTATTGLGMNNTEQTDALNRGGVTIAAENAPDRILESANVSSFEHQGFRVTKKTFRIRYWEHLLRGDANYLNFILKYDGGGDAELKKLVQQQNLNRGAFLLNARAIRTDGKMFFKNE
jgi:hypothetical protein